MLGGAVQPDAPGNRCDDRNREIDRCRRSCDEPDEERKNDGEADDGPANLKKRE